MTESDHVHHIKALVKDHVSPELNYNQPHIYADAVHPHTPKLWYLEIDSDTRLRVLKVDANSGKLKSFEVVVFWD